jgi:hypothetical protein
MLFKPRTKPELLLLLELLNTRMKLTADALQQYLYQKKGYEGEIAFDLLTATLDQEMYIINDLMLEINHTKFQIDSLLVSQEKVYQCEIKNFESDYYYENGEFYFCGNKNPISNPLHQIKRAETLLKQYFQKNGFYFQLDPYLIFINPGFLLYGAPQNKSIIFPSQVNHFMKNLDSKPSNLSAKHKKLADKLVQDHIIESPYPKLPPYNYDSLNKGLTCATCNSFYVSCDDRKMKCNACGAEEDIESAIIRAVEEYKLLFPSLKVTTNIIFDWCRVVESRKTIRRILQKSYKAIGSKQWTYYE